MERLLIDCTKTYFFDDRTGIQRVVEEVCKNAAAAEQLTGIPCVPVVYSGRELVVVPQPYGTPPRSVRRTAALARQGFKFANRIRERFAGVSNDRSIAIRLPTESKAAVRFGSLLYRNLCRQLALIHRAQLVPAAPGPRDVLLLADATWGNLVPRGYYGSLRDLGCRLLPLIHDIMPVCERHTFTPEFADRFEHWLNWMLRHADGIITNSAATKSELASYLRQRPNSGIPLTSVQLGCNPTTSQETPRSSIRSRLEKPDKVMRFFCLGTLEPRKNHGLVLDAMERLWDDGCEVELLVVGKQGWKCEAFVQRLRSHPQSGRRLHVFHDLNDSEVELAFQTSDALVTASINEGLGLPILEALRRHKPVFASRIPAHLEAGQRFCSYFDPHSADELYTSLSRFVQTGQPTIQADLTHRRWPTWLESTVQIVEAAQRLTETSPAVTRRAA